MFISVTTVLVTAFYTSVTSIGYTQLCRSSWHELHLPTFGLSLQEKDCIWVNTQTIIILWTHSVLPIIDKNSMLPLYSPCLRHRALNYISMLVYFLLSMQTQEWNSLLYTCCGSVCFHTITVYSCYCKILHNMEHLCQAAML